MQKYLEASYYVDWQSPEILRVAHEIAKKSTRAIDVAQACFEFVRDDIKHSSDFELNPVTCKASDVLKYGTGFCYAKSHLLAALLRANKIPAGLCYQRLTINHNRPPFSLHGLNALYLDEFGWYRVDARGNKDGITASFCPPKEQLAYPIRIAGEIDLPEIWTQPLPEVVAVLEAKKTFKEVADDLPDLEILSNRSFDAYSHCHSKP